MVSERFDEAPFDLRGGLPAGVIVLEASAGTGKTFTIAALTARFIAEGAPLDELLLVTFTRMATGELRERVRDRLVFTERELGRVLAGAAPSTDDDIVALLASGQPDEIRLRRARLAAALAGFDAATIATTHGFCQEVLDELGTLGDLEPDVTFLEDVDDLIEEVVDDLYVRRFHREGEAPLDRAQAGMIARLAIDHPVAQIYPGDGAAAVPAMRRRLADAAREELARRKHALALMTYDDLLTRLRGTLAGPSGEAAAARLRARYRVVLIDEFQDTDPIQWEIVERAFGGGGTTLVLIGDPKQAIYAFRGADVYAYLRAVRAAVRQTLRVNRRSDQRLIDGLDALLAGARLGHEGIVYRRVEAAPGHGGSRLRDAPVPAALRFRVLDRLQASVDQTYRGYATAFSARAHIARDLAADVVALLASPASIERRNATGEVLGLDRIAPGDVAVLVQSHRNAALIQAELDAAGVPAVINGAGSVFNTDAATDWLRVLEAIERPASPPRARSAALTPLIGWDAARLAAAGEVELEELHRTLHAWARVLRSRGMAALAETVVLTGQVPGRVLTAPDGERRLTDLQHVAQLLHGAASAEHLGPAALTAWLRQRIAAAAREGGNDDLTRRLESDAEAVQVLTIHRSKGLEFPIVYCPFLWEPGYLPDAAEPVYFHDETAGDARAIDVGLEGEEYAEHREQYVREERGEDLRLAYVALTRAKHQAIVWFAGSFASRHSALGRLLFAREDDGTIRAAGSFTPTDQACFDRLTAIAERAPEAISVEWSRLGVPESWIGRPAPAGELAVARFDRQLDLSWRRTSYSALTATAHEAALTTAREVASEPEEPVVGDEPGGPVAGAAARPSGGEWPDLPLGAMDFGPAVGTLVHRALELVDFAAGDLPGALAAALRGVRATGTAELGCELEPAAEGLALALRTPRGGVFGEAALSDLRRADRLDELTFELPLAGGATPRARVGLDDLAALVRTWLAPDDPVAGYARRLADPALAARLSGYLTGSIDLVLRRVLDGVPRFAVVDYKTNWLAGPDEPLTAWHYRPAALAHEMERSHYVLQALLYSVALHRYLCWRLPGYDPEVNLAGVRYLFLRGMTGPGTPVIGGGRCGVFAWRPPTGLVVALSELLEGVPA